MTARTREQKVLALANACWLAGVTLTEMERGMSECSDEDRRFARLVYLKNQLDMPAVDPVGAEYDRRSA